MIKPTRQRNGGKAWGDGVRREEIKLERERFELEKEERKQRINQENQRKLPL